MVLGGKLAVELAFLLPFSQFRSDHFRKELFSFNEGHLYISVRVALHRELLGNAFGQALIDSGILGREMLNHPSALGCCFNCFAFGRSEEVVEFGDELFHCGDELNEAFGNEHRTEIITVCGTLCHNAGDIGYDVVERLVLFLNLFAHDANVGLALQGTFEGDMAGGAAHKFDEVPVFASGVSIALDVTNHFGIGLTSRVETE